MYVAPPSGNMTRAFFPPKEHKFQAVLLTPSSEYRPDYDHSSQNKILVFSLML